MQSITSAHAKLFQPLTPNLYNGHNEIDDDDDYIPLPDVKTCESLITHAKFCNIQQQFLADILKLKELAYSYVDHTYDNKIDFFYRSIQNSSKYQNSGYPDFGLLKIFKFTRYEIHQLVAELSKKQTDAVKDYLTNLLHDCLYGIDVCLDGIASRFKVSYLNLKTVQAGLNGLIYNIKTELLHAFIKSFIFEQKKENLLNIGVSMEVHYFNAFHNMLCEEMHLEKILDFYEPKDISSNLIQHFRNRAKLYVNDFTIVQKLAHHWNNKIATILKELKVEHWEKNVIAAKEITFKQLEIMDKNVFQPMNSLHEIATKKEAIDFYTIVKELNDECYSFSEYHHRIHAWIAARFCDEPKVLTKISSNEQNTQYIGSMDGIFFWVFKEDANLSCESTCNFDSNNYIALSLKHLTAIDFETWTEEQSYPLLIQAITQTQLGHEFLDFFHNPWVLQQLNRLKSPLHTLLFNVIIERHVVSHDDDFKQALSTCIEHYFKVQGSKFTHHEIIDWFVNTPLFEHILLSFQHNKIYFENIIKKLTLKEIITYSPETIKIIAQQSQYNVRSIFEEIIKLKKVDLLFYLIKNGCADLLNHNKHNIKNFCLILFTQHNAIEAVEYLLKQLDINVNIQYNDGYTPLMHAVKKGYITCAQILLAHKNISLDKQNNKGYTVFHFAVYLGNVDFLKKLLSKANLINDAFALYMSNTFLDTNFLAYMYYMFTSPPPVSFIDINNRNKEGKTPLHIAVYSNNTACLKVLLDQPYIFKNATTNNGWSALHIAARFGYLDCVQTLLAKNANINLKTIDGSTALHFAARFGYLDCTRELLTKEDILINAKNNKGWTALHEASNNNHFDCLQALLLNNNININETSNDGSSALYLASSLGYSDCVQALLSKTGIEINGKDN